MRRSEDLSFQGTEQFHFSAEFVPGLLDPERGAPAFITGPNGKAAGKRYNVYRNNVTVSLINALAAAFPATKRITGEDFFRAMARFHVRASPPTSPLLFEYGRGFPDFIAAYEHARPVPWLADVARVERAWLDAYHAADATPLLPCNLEFIPADRISDVVLTPHPSTRIVRSQFPAVSIFAAHRSDDPSQRIEASGSEDALITRPGLEVFVRHLPAGGAEFLSSLTAGHSLGMAVQAGFDSSSEFDPAASIAGMIAAGAFTAVKLET